MRHGSLFSGIGGFDLAAEWIGWENVFHCEWKEFNQKILKYYWPNAQSYSDITKTDFSIHRGTIDVLTGGFPCQPYSLAGKRKGKEDDRHLWPEMRRAIREIRPRWVVGENVYGLINWNGGMVFDEVQADLEAEGYEVFPYVLPACGVNAPHKRDRVWFIAYSGSTRHGRVQQEPGQKFQDKVMASGIGKEGAFTNSNSQRLQVGIQPRIRSIQDKNGSCSRRESSRTYSESQQWGEFPTVSPICNGNDGLSGKLDRITFSSWRKQSIEGGGNAIVPQVALEIFKVINEIELTKTDK